MQDVRNTIVSQHGVNDVAYALGNGFRADVFTAIRRFDVVFGQSFDSCCRVFLRKTSGSKGTDA